MACQTETVQVSDPTITLNRDQLRDITLDDEELMREVLTALVDDTSRQIQLLAAAIEHGLDGLRHRAFARSQCLTDRAIAGGGLQSEDAFGGARRARPARRRARSRLCAGGRLILRRFVGYGTAHL